MIRWYSLRDAARMLSIAAGSLRKRIERNVYLAADGVLEARVDGIRARKFGGRWRVCFSQEWT